MDAQNAEATSPSAEVPKTEERLEENAVTNGEALAEEVSKPDETPKPAAEPVKSEEETKPVEEPKVPEPVVEKPVESAPSPVKEEVPPVEEPTPKVEEPKPIEPTPVVEETKEVRSEEVPPPLPSSNPPSPVTVFAESTKADALPADQVPLETPLSAPVVETVPEPVSAEQKVDSIPQATTAPVVENISELESAPVVEGKIESVSSDSSKFAEQTESLKEPIQVTPESNVTDSKPPPIDSSLPILDGAISSPLAGQTPSDIESVEIVNEPAKEPETNPIPPAVETQQPVEGEMVKSKEDVTGSPKSPEPAVEPSTPVENKPELPVEPQEAPVEQSQPPQPSIPVEETKPLEGSASPAAPSSPVPPAPKSPLPSPDIASASDNSPDPVAPSPEPTLSLQSEQVTPEPVTEQLPEPVSESVVNADSLPDISTESLPSMPEPVSENLAEPMSLPPVDSVPEPIATDSLPECPLSDARPSTDSPVLTNGNANGLPSPTDEVSPQAVKEGPLKQVPGDVCEESEKRQETGDKAKDEPAAPATVEE